MKQYTEEELSGIYENLSENLKEALFSTATSRNILNTCKRNDVPNENIGDVAEAVGYVLLGLLPPEELEIFISQKTGLSPEVSKDVVREIARFILFPLKDEIANLYDITKKDKAEGIEKSPSGVGAKKIPEENTRENVIAENNDLYREPIE